MQAKSQLNYKVLYFYGDIDGRIVRNVYICEELDFVVYI